MGTIIISNYQSFLIFLFHFRFHTVRVFNFAQINFPFVLFSFSLFLPCLASAGTFLFTWIFLRFFSFFVAFFVLSRHFLVLFRRQSFTFVNYEFYIGTTFFFFFLSLLLFTFLTRNLLRNYLFFNMHYCWQIGIIKEFGVNNFPSLVAHFSQVCVRLCSSHGSHFLSKIVLNACRTCCSSNTKLRFLTDFGSG